MSGLERGILATVVYHDLFDMPLTAQEARLSLPASAGRPGMAAVLSGLDAARRSGRLDCERGLWFLAGRESLVAERLRRYDLAERKYARALRFMRMARHLPYLRAAFVCNTLGRSIAREESDIDLFVVAEPGRVWLARFFAAGLAAALGMRPTAETSRDRICLSFFAASDALDLRSRAIEGDVYLPRWLNDLTPVMDEIGASGRLFAENGWAREALPNMERPAAHPRRSFEGRPSVLKKALERLIEAGGERLERRAKAFQLRLMPERLKENAARNGGVVLSDAMLKFHDRDRREEIRDAFRARLASYAVLALS